MSNSGAYNEVLLEHNNHPYHKHALTDATCSQHGINPSCGDEITIELTIKDNIIEKAAFKGDGCAISQASTDIMLDLIIGQTREEALALTDIFFKMAHGEVLTEEEEAHLEEALALHNVSHMPARVKCATLPWHTLIKMLRDK